MLTFFIGLMFGTSFGFLNRGDDDPREICRRAHTETCEEKDRAHSDSADKPLMRHPSKKAVKVRIGIEMTDKCSAYKNLRVRNLFGRANKINPLSYPT